MIFILPIPFFQKFKIVKKQTGSIDWAKQIKQKAGDAFVMFNEGFQEPSKYDYYNNTLKGFSYNSRNYRKNQFDMWFLEDSLRNQKVYYVQSWRHSAARQDSFPTTKGMWFGRWVDSVRTYQKVEIKVGETSKEWDKGEVRCLELRFYNPYQEEISFSNKGQKWNCYLEYGYMKEGKLIDVFSLGERFHEFTISSKKEVNITANIKAPSESGKYKLIFSIRTDPFPGTRNSRMISINVK
jgi:hypothetical protein